jgi:hypothetical protein
MTREKFILNLKCKFVDAVSIFEIEDVGIADDHMFYKAGVYSGYILIEASRIEVVADYADKSLAQSRLIINIDNKEQYTEILINKIIEAI